jgi:60 kDa SS-A/Ro ribonucleoprotein
MNARQLFRFVADAHDERGWGRSLRSTVAKWYIDRPVAEVAADMLKCPEHEGWTHRDLLRLAHPKPESQAQNALFQWAVDGELGHLATPDLVTGELRQVYAVDRLKRTGDEREALSLVEQYALTHDMVPEPWRRSEAVWESLLTGMSAAEIVDHLMEFADAGLLVEESPATALVVARLVDRRRITSSGLTRARIASARDQYAAHPRALPLVVRALQSALAFL